MQAFHQFLIYSQEFLSTHSKFFMYMETEKKILSKVKYSDTKRRLFVI